MRLKSCIQVNYFTIFHANCYFREHCAFKFNCMYRQQTNSQSAEPFCFCLNLELLLQIKCKSVFASLTNSVRLGKPSRKKIGLYLNIVKIAPVVLDIY